MLEYKWLELIKKNKRETMRRERIRRSRLAWILDTSPYETHLLFLRTVDEQRAREQVRHTYSWHNLCRLQNENIFKAGLAGIVTAPILAGLSNYEGAPISLQFPYQMGLIFLSGLLYVLATSICNLRVPYFVQLYLLDDTKRRYRATPLKDINAAIFKEFSNLASTIKIQPSEFYHLCPREFEVAVIAHHQGHFCYKTGFRTPALALIDKLLHKLSDKHGFKMFERSGDQLQPKRGPGTIYGNEIYIRHIYIETAQDHYLNPDNSLNLTIEDVLFINTDAPLQLEFTDPGDVIEPYVHGLTEIIRSEYLETYIEELSYWQSWQRPLSRIVVLWMYRMALISFSCFLAYQTSVVWDAIDFSNLLIAKEN